jgi:predicted phage terminase large subunit-like protein
MAALQYVDIRGYSALLLRRTYTDLSLPGALMDMAQAWLRGTDAVWHEMSKTWHFPSGAMLTFGHLQNENDKYRYQSSQFQFIGFDELTQFTETKYRYLFSRLRRLKHVNIPIRMRSATNPGGLGSDWVYNRFLVETETNQERLFIPAKLDDNPHMDKDAYVQSLNELDPITREQLLNGDWSVRQPGSMFQRSWFRIIDMPTPDITRKVRYWDLAATEANGSNDPDYTAGVLIGEKDGQYYILDVVRERLTPAGVEKVIRKTAEVDGVGVDIWIEQEGGSGGKNTIDYYARHVLKGYSLRGDPVSGAGSKTLRAKPLSAASENGNVYLVRGNWLTVLLDELEAFPLGGHDDMVDACSGALRKLSAPRFVRVYGGMV